MAPKIAIIFYSMFGHIEEMARAEAEGIEAAGGSADLYRVPETLSPEVLDKMHAPSKNTSDIAELQNGKKLCEYDGFIIGIPSRYGNFPAQWKAFWDHTGGLWARQSLAGKYASVFVSTSVPGGGQEETAMCCLSTFVHHGITYVPLGFKKAFAQLTDMSEVRGGSPWGAGTFSGNDDSRRPTTLEKEIARLQGQWFCEQVSRACP